MRRKLSLPLLNLGQLIPVAARRPAKPTVDVVRERLGGRASTEPGAGELVTLTTSGGATLAGVVLFRRGDVVDVWIDSPETTSFAMNGIERAGPGAAQGVVRRAHRDDVAPLRTPTSESLGAIAADARVFGALIEGQRIRFQDGGDLSEGTLVEKCRFGGLVQRDDGTLLGVGFRRLWPAQNGDVERN
ncbi:hypothetical protein SOCE26_027630 [Sorangium cellulosum]|uniref:Uncharacterized protein n=1 Tax=Sorangium cellulosum TaxID=56 RepID=A0A2L0EQ08_SORCE|nr:hypothetical protein [Sorangium cellulosum]AUX41352.1 hypothetical protein SOCE26_027630 [Sorangium cellulosum]